MRNHIEVNGALAFVRLDRKKEPNLHVMIDTADIPKLTRDINSRMAIKSFPLRIEPKLFNALKRQGA